MFFETPNRGFITPAQTPLGQMESLPSPRVRQDLGLGPSRMLGFRVQDQIPEPILVVIHMPSIIDQDLWLTYLAECHSSITWRARNNFNSITIVTLLLQYEEVFCPVPVTCFASSMGEGMLRQWITSSLTKYILYFTLIGK